MKRSSDELWIENVEETGCLEPAFKQKINDEDDYTGLFFFWKRKTDEKSSKRTGQK